MSVDAEMEAYLKEYCVKHNCTPEEAESMLLLNQFATYMRKRIQDGTGVFYG